MIKSQHRDFKGALVVNVAFVDENLAPQDVVARKRVAEEFKFTQRKLLAFRNRELEVRNALFRIRGIIFESRLNVILILDKPLRAVSLLQVFLKSLADALAVGNVA